MIIAPKVGKVVSYDSLDVIRQLSYVNGNFERAFGFLATVRELQESVLNDYPSLVILPMESKYAVDMSHLGTKIRFELLVALDENDSPAGRVVCFVPSDETLNLEPVRLGDFFMSSHGITDLHFGTGQFANMVRNSDLIIAKFFLLAHRRNFSS